MNELRRDPVSGRWSIIIQDPIQTDRLLVNLRQRTKATERYDPNCPFCQGNESQTPPEIHAVRAVGPANAPGWLVRVVPDKFPVLRVEGALNNRAHGMYDMLDGIGAHEIVVETPEHNRWVTELDEAHLVQVLRTYQLRIADLKRDLRFRYILVYKSHGEAMGPAGQHSYSYVIATPVTPPRVKQELLSCAQHFSMKERCLICDVVRQEENEGSRIVIDGRDYLAFVPFASGSPLETWIVPKRHETFFESTQGLEELASIYRRTLGAICELLHEPNYVMLIHSGPNTTYGQRRGYWRTLTQDYHWHMEIVPMVRGFTSFELVSGMRVNFLPPERGAAMLREKV
ncbi:MAG: galactose-1-phosphate uridylyltransferase [candidate division KSB1 bacterium]|nr:galactose-1-phosphate uridylyltransferase [candidate division KSB1 bacterium]